jgi:hypothetical protein
MAAYAVVSIALAFALGMWTHWRYALSRTADEVRASCRHRWGEVWEVGQPTLRAPQRFYKRSCSICGAQRDVNADGTPYEPPKAS